MVSLASFAPRLKAPTFGERAKRTGERKVFETKQPLAEKIKIVIYGFNLKI